MGFLRRLDDRVDTPDCASHAVDDEREPIAASLDALGELDGLPVVDRVAVVEPRGDVFYRVIAGEVAESIRRKRHSGVASARLTNGPPAWHLRGTNPSWQWLKGKARKSIDK